MDLENDSQKSRNTLLCLAVSIICLSCLLARTGVSGRGVHDAKVRQFRQTQPLGLVINAGLGADSKVKT